MAGHRSTLRKTPPGRLKQYFTNRIDGFPSDFDWTSGGTALADQLDAAISNAGSPLENRVRIELETIDGVADRDGWRSVEEVCRGADIDLDRCKGQHDAIMMLALQHEKVFERVVSASSFMRRNGGKDWSAFELTNVSPDSFIGDAAAKERFIREALAILEVPPGRKHEADWYDAVRRDPITGEESRVTHATVYIEERPESSLAFGENGSVEMRMVPRVGELGFSYDPKDRAEHHIALAGAPLPAKNRHPVPR